MRHRAQPRSFRQLEHGRIRLGRVLRLEPAETDPDDAAIRVLGGIADNGLCLVEREPADDVRRQANLDAVQLARLLGSVAITPEDLLPGDPAPDALGRREDALDVDRAVRRRFGRVVDDDPPEVVARAKRVRRQHPDLDEVLEIAVLVELGEALHGVCRERVLVAPRDLEEGLRPHGPFEMDVQLDLGITQLSPVPVSGSPGSTPCAAQRFSKKTAAQIDPSKSKSTGTACRPIDTKSTPGRRTTTMMQMPTPIRRLLRSRAAETIPSRTRPRMKIGSSKRIPQARIVTIANE